MFDTDDTDDRATDPTLVPDDSDGATETPASPADSDPLGSSDGAPSGPPRDPAGRFAPKANAPQGRPTSALAVPDGAPAPDDPDAPAATLEDGSADPAATPPASVPDPATSAETPYAFTHRGQAYAVEGAVVRPDGALVVPAAARARIDALLSRGREHEVYGPELTRKSREEVQHWRSRAEARDAGVDAFSALLADQPDPETFLARALDFYEKLPQLREAQLRQRIQELERSGQPAQATADADGVTADVLSQAITDGTTQHLVAARAQLPEFQGFTDQELVALRAELLPRANLYIREATAADETQWGVPQGTPVIDNDRLVKELRLLAGPMLQTKRAEAAKAKQAAAVNAAADRNKAVLTKPKLEPVPRSGAESAGGGRRTFTSKEEWDDWDGR